MRKFAQIIDEKTGLCNVATGNDNEYYKSIGFEYLNVIQSDVDNNWYLADKCPQKSLEDVKAEKLKEALDGANDYIENKAVYRYDENNTIEATDGNIGKLTAYALGLSSATLKTVQWTSKEDNVLTLTLNDVLQILTGLGKVQSNVWNKKYIDIKNRIEDATTIKKVEGIEVNYE